MTKQVKFIVVIIHPRGWPLIDRKIAGKEGDAHL